MAAATTPRIIVVGGGLAGLSSVNKIAEAGGEYPNARADVMPAQPAGVTLPAPTTATPSSTNPTQPGEPAR